MTSADYLEQKRRIREQAIDWVLTLEGNEPSRAELDRLERWLATDERHAAAFEQVRQLYGDTGKALLQEPEKTRKHIRSGRGKPAALVTVLIVCLGLLPFISEGLVYFQADRISATNELLSFNLADGSTLEMNAETALAEDFDDGRAIELLRGEIFLEVEKDPSRPFVVSAGAGRIEVLGTAFNVNRIGDWTEVTVTESTVRVTANGQSVLLTEGMRVRYDGDGNLEPVETVAEGTEASWRSGRLVFENRKLSWVVREIDRHLPGKLIVATDATANRLVSGSFDLGNPEQALEGFSEAFGLTYYRAGPLGGVIR
ncbi:FecR family protein [Roseibium aggregatum]|uniref:FecR family protein n=1 Tax=Roseibium aggregatum TaxID=187304 RepID=A0A939EFC9_9HYPH|nr:FecR family protein [Roseibium aggregatum]MBN9672212.1 FecR family protein [Roseibium aggregatum]